MIIAEDTSVAGLLGWLPPDGKFIPVEFGGHNQFAKRYLEKAYGMTLEDTSMAMTGNPYSRYCSGDYLVYKLGWVLIDEPGFSIIVTRDDTKHLTNAQKDFLYQYFIELGDEARAASFLEL